MSEDEFYIYGHCINALFNLRKRVVYLLAFKTLELLIFLYCVVFIFVVLCRIDLFIDWRKSL